MFVCLYVFCLFLTCILEERVARLIPPLGLLGVSVGFSTAYKQPGLDDIIWPLLQVLHFPRHEF